MQDTPSRAATASAGRGPTPGAPEPASLPLRLAYHVRLSYEVRSAPADFVFNIQAARTPRQQVLSEWLSISPPLPRQEYVDPYSAGRFLRVRAQPGLLELRYVATLELFHHMQPAATVHEVPVAELPGAVLPYLYPSRYCESDKLGPLALSTFGAHLPGHARVQAIAEWVRSHVEFTPGSSDSTTSATDTLSQGRGVCRDFAHLMIALCRAVNIPARFSTGLDYGADPALGPTDFHAYVEAYLGGRWYLFDPSGTAIPMGMIRLASGRDAADAAYASIFGQVVPGALQLHIEAVPGIDGVRREPARTDLALSTSDT